MRLSLTRPKGRRRWIAGMAVAATAAVTLATAALAPSAWAQGPDSSLCKMNTSRVQIPANLR